jgi:hypothetical protein
MKYPRLNDRESICLESQETTSTQSPSGRIVCVMPIPVDITHGERIVHIVLSLCPVLLHIPIYLSGIQGTDLVSFIQRSPLCLPKIECTPSMRLISFNPLHVRTCEHSSKPNVLL